MWDEELELWYLIKCVYRGKYVKKVLEFFFYVKKFIRLVGCLKGGNLREYFEVEGIG